MECRSLAKFTWFQADPANFNKQHIIWKGCCTKDCEDLPSNENGTMGRNRRYIYCIYIYIMIYLEHFEAPSCSLAGCMIYLEHFEAPSCSLAGCMIYLEHFEAPSCSLAGCSGATTNTPQRRVENHSVKTPALVVKLTSPRPHFWTQVFGWAGVWHTTPMGTVPRHVASAEFSTEVPPVDLRFGMLMVQAFRCFHLGMEMRLSSPVYKRFKTHCIFFKIRTHLRIYDMI